MDLLLRGGRVIDVSSGPERVVDAALDVVIRDGRVAELGSGLAAPSGARVVDVRDKLVVPGLVDLHVHLREPGHEYKEDVESGTAAAAAGGFTTICCMPNTSPTNDCRAVTELITRRAREVGAARVRPIGAISQGLEGRALAEFGEMRDAGIVAVSDDGRPVMDAGLMRRALEYARTFDLPVVQHAEDLGLSAGFAMHEGPVSTRLGLPGQPAPAESVMVARDIELCELTGGRYHVAHVSVARTVELLRDARRRGLPVSGEVTPHHLTLLDHACDGYETCFKVAPPLRTEADRQALIEALADGTLECIATDHAPHSSLEKDVEFEAAACGMLGLETALAIILEFVRDGSVPLVRAIDALTAAPARLFGLDQDGVGSLATGAPADVCVIDLDAGWTIDRDAMRSKSKNTPFHGREVVGAAALTLLAGRPVHDPQEMLA
jgi:dihydroorotase